MIATAQLGLIVPLVLSVALGALMGLERSVAGKHAGMRTYALVSLGSCLFVLIGVIASYQLAAFATVNPLTIGSNVVVAIGFLGIGLTVFRGDHPVELTTAAGLWVVSAVGMACGFGLYTLAVSTTVISVIVLTVLLRGENSIRRRFGGADN